MNGVLNIYKPRGISSFGVVAEIRKISGIKKVGHTGTLDPEAEGVLPICLGKGTKMVEIIMNGDKEYLCTMALGFTTDTYDLEGKILSRSYDIPCKEEIKKTINSFLGKSYQEPPMYSAIKKNGIRMYELARQGITIEREKRLINIKNIKIIKIEESEVEFLVTVSKGTYIRTLCFDIGEKLGCGATMTKLIRTGTSIFKIENSIKLSELNKDNLMNNIISIEKIFENYKILKLNKKFEKLIINGVKINDPDFINSLEEGMYRIYGEKETFLGIGKVLDGRCYMIFLV